MNEEKKEKEAARFDEILSDIRREINQAHLGVNRRRDLIKQIEDYENDKKRKLILYIAKEGAPIDSADIAPFGSMLQSVGKTKYLDLMLQSAGGAGTTAEKIVDLCRHYCEPDGEFRVIIPQMAKSAATLIAIASDQIVMGVTSEIGPIDPQVPVIQAGVPHYISAQSFINAKTDLEKQTQEAISKNQSTQPYLVQLSTLHQPFIQHCIHLIGFAKDFATTNLERHMCKDNKQSAEDIATKLLSTSKYFVHGRMITAENILKDEQLKNLNIKYLKDDDPYWVLIYKLYLSAEIFLNIDNEPPFRKGKLLESADFFMVATIPYRN